MSTALTRSWGPFRKNNAGQKLDMGLSELKIKVFAVLSFFLDALRENPICVFSSFWRPLHSLVPLPPSSKPVMWVEFFSCCHVSKYFLKFCLILLLNSPIDFLILVLIVFRSKIFLLFIVFSVVFF